MLTLAFHILMKLILKKLTITSLINVRTILIITSLKWSALSFLFLGSVIFMSSLLMFWERAGKDVTVLNILSPSVDASGLRGTVSC